MKHPLKIAIVTLTTLGAPVLAFADPGTGHHRGKDEAHKARRLAKYDTNGDGTLDDAERKAAQAHREAKRQARHAEMLAQYDSNRDGTLDETERQAMRRDRIDQAFARLDTNHDGALTREEFGAGAKAFRGHGHHRR